MLQSCVRQEWPVTDIILVRYMAIKFNNRLIDCIEPCDWDLWFQICKCVSSNSPLPITRASISATAVTSSPAVQLFHRNNQHGLKFDIIPSAKGERTKLFVAVIYLLNFCWTQKQKISYFFHTPHLWSKLTSRRRWATRWNIGSDYSSCSSWITQFKFISMYFLHQKTQRHIINSNHNKVNCLRIHRIAVS